MKIFFSLSVSYIPFFSSSSSAYIYNNNNNNNFSNNIRYYPSNSNNSSTVSLDRKLERLKQKGISVQSIVLQTRSLIGNFTNKKKVLLFVFFFSTRSTNAYSRTRNYPCRCSYSFHQFSTWIIHSNT